jgi:NAD(P)-dependent dehydrogenase (short-subunit alcohol dehydrogenase family)/ABC-type glycerol-3-phosphate transport system substrate-binding protein
MPTALITGTSTGIGEACVALLAARGWTIYAGVRRERDGERLRAAQTGDVRPVILDVSNRDHLARVVDELATAVGDAGLQGLVNNAGVGVGGPSEYLEVDAWRTVFEANFFGVVSLTRAAMPLLKRGRGRVVHIGSIGGRIATPGLAPYAASKHALEALAEASRLEFTLAGSPVRVSLIEPGAVATAIWDKGDASVDELEARFARGEGPEYAWLLDEARGFVTEGRRTGIPPSRVADAVEHWQDVRAKVDTDLAAWNGTGLPDEYALESDPNRWDSYDLTVVATYWATREFEGLTVPRVAHAAALEGGADWDLASRCYGAGAENSELAALDGLGLRDAFAWESYWFAHGLYHPSMTRESWGRREILSAIAQGQIFLAPLAPADFFRLHGTADGGGDGLLKNPADLGFAQWPQARSLEIERGYPARTGAVRAARGGGWWGVPKSSPDPSLALAFVEHVTSTEFATAHCRKFGVLPARLDVLQELDEVLKDAWQFDIARAAKRQALTLGRTMPSSDRWLAARAGLVAAWKDACVTRHEKAPIALQEALTNQASLAGSSPGSSAGSSR